MVASFLLEYCCRRGKADGYKEDGRIMCTILVEGEVRAHALSGTQNMKISRELEKIIGDLGVVLVSSASAAKPLI
jgi:hypothetical protein